MSEPGETAAGARRPTPAETTAGDFATWGPVHLEVTALERSLTFWRDLVGLSELGGDGSTGVRLGAGEEQLVVLHEGAAGPVRRGHSGLYHLAIHLPSEAEFARALGRLFAARYPNAPTDHITHWATYLDDPDGIQLELAFETIDRFGGYSGAGIIGSDGRMHGITEALELERVFSHLGPEPDLARPLAEGARVGHLHLHVGEIEPALAFYAECLGFGRGLSLEPMGFADMNARGGFPHRLAVNTWQGSRQPPAGTAGMRHAVLRYRDPGELERAQVTVSAAGAVVAEADGVVVADPSGNRTLLSPA